ncbi:hypothetical protein Poli38472_003665 [Pythium oligandrum]|uniref:Uncharacterized protein n=1 Tax=Pythium oligandrum TaxID=41045 RepID=A0A8K1CNL4_PYTOL|nr:hypothetical protein Poli38472_003665 [Pythium oligandrum]|eukprot:TMW65900.1 hypothetical protein Poli38472_003665 [Pythium oligandrum]
MASLSPSDAAFSAPMASPAASPSPSADASPLSSYYAACAALYALGTLYLLPSVLAWTRMWRNIHTEDRTAVRLFSLLGMGCLLRAVAFALVAIWMIVVITSSGTASVDKAEHLHLTYLQLVTLWQAVGMVASFVLVSVFLLVFNTWASMIEQVGSSNSMVAAAAYGASSASRTPPRVLFLRMVLATYALQILTLCLVHALPSSELCRNFHFIATSLLAVCFLCCIFLLPSYGARMCELLGKVAEGADRRQRNVRRVAAICTVFFILRTAAQSLLAASEYAKAIGVESMKDEARIIPLQRVVDANPIFFFSPDHEGADGDELLRWVVLVEVAEFPIEWVLLMMLLCVLPARAVLPSIRGYQSIPDMKRRV